MTRHDPPFPVREKEIGAIIEARSTPLGESLDDLEPLMDLIGDARYVLLGEASHGTHEYYTWRARLSKRLIREKGFSFIAVEGDWPDCYRLNRYIKGYTDAGNSATEVLQNFNRWPSWMWANWEIAALAEWLRKFNRKQLPGQKVGFYGLDVYSLSESMEAILVYLAKKDPQAFETARRAAACFEAMGGESENYARATYLVPRSCENEVVDLLQEIRSKVAQYNTDMEAVLSAEQNAHILVEAEHYYRAMIRGGAVTWNIRDTHMANTLYRLMDFYGPEAKVIVWAHNTHIGDARATDMAAEGMVNIGELIHRDELEEGVIRIGFGAYRGKVIAARGWGDKMRHMKVPPARKGSWERILHQTGKGDQILTFDELKNEPVFQQPIRHRAIGVVYNPEYEPYRNYVPSILPRRYEAFVYLDNSSALLPLPVKTDEMQIPETYPFGV